MAVYHAKSANLSGVSESVRKNIEKVIKEIVDGIAQLSTTNSTGVEAPSENVQGTPNAPEATVNKSGDDHLM